MSENQGLIGWPFPPVTIELDLEHCALLVVDMQYNDAHPGYGLGVAMESVRPGCTRYFFDRIWQTVVPNIQKLLAVARDRGMRVIYTATGSLTHDLSDLTPVKRRRYQERNAKSGAKTIFGKGAFELSILTELKPLETELVITKTASNAFISSMLDQVLRNMEINSLLIAGVVTNACVESAARDAADLGYHCFLVEDGCAAHSPEADAATFKSYRSFYGRVGTTTEALELLKG